MVQSPNHRCMELYTLFSKKISKQQTNWVKYSNYINTCVNYKIVIFSPMQYLKNILKQKIFINSFRIHHL